MSSPPEAEKAAADPLKESVPENGAPREVADVGETDDRGFMTSAERRPGYYSSPFVIGSIVAIGFSSMAGIGGFSLAAPLLTQINQDIGRLSDLFGRRWFFIGSNIVALVGSIICAGAQNVDSLIGGNTLVGISSAAQVSFPYVLTELMPMNWRFYSMAYIYILVIPFTGIGRVVSNPFVDQTAASWRGIYYLMIPIDAMQALLMPVLSTPHIYKRVMSELNTLPRDRVAQYEIVLETCPYYIACVKEALRLTPSAPTYFPRYPPSDGMKLFDKFVPPG